MKKNNYELSVVVAGKPVREYNKDNNTFIEGQKDSEYIIRFKNNTKDRVMVIFSIDNLEPLSGGKAEDCKTGYIVDGLKSLELKGFRIDDNNVAAFKFSEIGQSYANSNGDPLQCGSIGVRVYSEKENELDWVKKKLQNIEDNLPPTKYIPVYPKTIWFPPYNPTSPQPIWTGGPFYRSINIDCSNESFQTTLNTTAELSNVVEPTDNYFNLGTTWGQKVSSPVTRVNFETGELVDTIIMYYTDREGLKNLGIEFEKVVKLPKTFDENKQMYCTPPPNWKG